MGGWFQLKDETHIHVDIYISNFVYNISPILNHLKANNSNNCISNMIFSIKVSQLKKLRMNCITKWMEKNTLI